MEFWQMIVGMILLVIAIIWIVFPLIVVSKFDEVIKALKEVNNELAVANHRATKRDKIQRGEEAESGG